MPPRTIHPSAAVVVVATLLPAGAAGAASGATAQELPEESHCVLRIVGTDVDGAYETAPPDCYPTLAEALANSDPPATPLRLGAGSATAPDVGAADPAVRAASGSTLAVHFDGAHLSGSSIVITGGTCGGGHVNLSSSWTNRISSTLNSCETVVFWDGFDKSGSYEATDLLTVNLGALNNRANSVGYA
jgi:hypothetical protein